MATKQVSHIAIYDSVGATDPILTLDGQLADNFLGDYGKWRTSGLPKAGVVGSPDAAEYLREYIHFEECICKVRVLPNTQEEIDDPVCNDIPCPEDRVTPAPAE